MISPRAYLGVDVDLTYEQPLPWNAAEVHISFYEGSSFTGQVHRSPGDLLRLDLDGLTVPVGTSADLQWTQEDRGCYARGVVADPPTEPGLFIRIEESMSGVERRLDVRLPIHIPAALISPAGQVFPGHSANLSLRGARLIVDPTRSGEEIRYALNTAGITEDSPSTAALTLPTGIVNLDCTATVTGRVPGEVRVRFRHDSRLAFGQIGALLRAEQHRMAARLASTSLERAPRQGRE